MTTERATRRYFQIFIPSMIIYLAGTLGTDWVADNEALPPYAVYAMACIPIFAMLSVFWGHRRFINEIDEFLRTIQIKAVLFGTACLLVVAMGWGSLEMFADVPRLQVFWLMPLFWVAYAAAAGLITKREGGVF